MAHKRTVVPGKLEEKMTVMRVTPENCTGCLQCQMVCSLTYHGRVNPEEAHILIERDAAGYRFLVGFTAECRKGCRLCANHCSYGCLVPLHKEVAADG